MNSGNKWAPTFYVLAGVFFIINALLSGKYVLIMLGVCLIIIGGTLGRFVK